MSDRPRILVTNDDGVGAKGIADLAEAMEPLGEVWVVAPEREQSAASHALSIHSPVRLNRLGDRRFAVEGTPADAVYLALTFILKETPPALVVSGINHGPNLAADVFYSGTVAAAMEGALLGVPGIAFSLVSSRDFVFTDAAAFAAAVVKAALSNPLAPHLLLNVNIPSPGPVQGYRVAKQGRHTYGAGVVESRDPWGRDYFWLGGSDYRHFSEPGTDVSVIHEEQLATITPLLLDLTDHGAIAPIRKWKLNGFQMAEPLERQPPPK